MSQQLYGRNREEPYAPSYGQGSNFMPKIPPVVENRQSQKKPVFINYYPSGNTNNPQKVIAQVETVTRGEVVQNPVPMIDPMKETRNHHHGGDGQSKRDDEFINKLRDETIKATADLNNASRIIEPKVISTTNLDHQLQLSEQPRKYHGNGTMNDNGWVEPADPNQPRKVAELMSRVSNWKGVTNGARPISGDGYNNKLGYGNGISRENGINNGWNKMPNVTQGYDHMGYGGDSRRTSLRSEEIGYYNGNRDTRRDDIMDLHTPRASGVYGITRDNGIDNGWNKMNNVTKGYENLGYGGDPRRTTPRSEESGYYNRDGGKIDGVYTRRDDIIDQYTPRASGGGYTISKPPPLTQQGRYDDPNHSDSRYATHGSGYNSGMGSQSGYNNNGRLEKAGEYDQVYGNGYNSGLSSSTTTVISSVDAVTKYKGAFVPMMRNGEQRRQQHVPVKI